MSAATSSPTGTVTRRTPNAMIVGVRQSLEEQWVLNEFTEVVQANEWLARRDDVPFVQAEAQGLSDRE
jgi:hypothetical protein